MSDLICLLAIAGSFSTSIMAAEWAPNDNIPGYSLIKCTLDENHWPELGEGVTIKRYAKSLFNFSGGDDNFVVIEKEASTKLILVQSAGELVADNSKTAILSDTTLEDLIDEPSRLSGAFTAIEGKKIVMDNDSLARLSAECLTAK